MFIVFPAVLFREGYTQRLPFSTLLEVVTCQLFVLRQYRNDSYPQSD